MRYHQIIREAITAPMLYHGTSLIRLRSIFHDNLLIGTPPRPGRPDDGPYGVSLTRYLRAALSHASKKTRKDEGAPAVLVFDRDKLARQFGRKLRPIDVLGIRSPTENNPYSGSEFEERVLGDIPHVTSFITQVIIPDMGAFDRYQGQCVAADPDDQRIFDLIRAKISD